MIGSKDNRTFRRKLRRKTHAGLFMALRHLLISSRHLLKNGNGFLTGRAWSLPSATALLVSVEARAVKPFPRRLCGSRSEQEAMHRVRTIPWHPAP